MVTVNVFFEGGANPSSNPNVDTMDNTTALREAFNTVLNAGLDGNIVRIAAFPAYAVGSTIKIRQTNSLLLIDLDGPKIEKAKRIQDQKLDDIKDDVFFMVQRMEAWILSQPETIETVFANQKVSSKKVADDNNLEKHPEEILHPDKVLDVILQRYFEETRNNKPRKLKYGKLKHSPYLIEALNIDKLRSTFEDVEALLAKVISMSA